ncbi:cytochrome b-c1 complex subunit 2, mitochondrial [Dermacentor albipictus]|uniref:cytochrome b-c1 complex subunit 2, mitochondrial n=1 Tax=Dermacentor albipictus TaxID=60249 RepID=UPI0031FBF6B6
MYGGIAMAAKIARIPGLRLQAVRAFAVQAAPKASQGKLEFLPKQDVETSTLPNGLTVTTLENYSPITRLAIVVKAGARYEDGSNLGITHTLRNAATLATKSHSKFAITKNLEYIGANLTACSTREHLIYLLECNRDDVHLALKFAEEVAFHPAFKHWEVKDVAPHLHKELALFQQNREAVLMEALHAAAFRGGLANSLYIKDFLVGHYCHEKLAHFVKKHVSAPRAVVSVVGADCKRVTDALKGLELSTNPGAEFLPSKFGSGESRMESAGEFVDAAVVAEGAGWRNPKECVALGVFAHLLGLGPRLPYSESQATKLGEAAAKATKKPFAATALNVNYTDTGLFGVALAGHPDDMDKLIKAVTSQVRTVAQKVADKDVQDAKQKMKAAVQYDRECHSHVAVEMGVHVSRIGQPWRHDELLQAIDAVTTQDVATVAARVSKGKPAMAAVGRLHNTPHVDELV